MTEFVKIRYGDGSLWVRPDAVLAVSRNRDVGKYDFAGTVTLAGCSRDIGLRNDQLLEVMRAAGIDDTEPHAAE